MTPEALALQLLASLFPLAVQALTEALNSGKGEAEALAAARLHLPDRIDTTDEDRGRRARMGEVVRMRHIIRGTFAPNDPPALPDGIGWRKTDPPPADDEDGG